VVSTQVNKVAKDIFFFFFFFFATKAFLITDGAIHEDTMLLELYRKVNKLRGPNQTAKPV
jgi:hypothetical protein